MPTYMIRRNGFTPFSSRRPLEQIESDLLRSLNAGWSNPFSEQRTQLQPQYDLTVTETEVRAAVVLPGLKAGSINVEVHEKALVVSGSQLPSSSEAIEGATILHQAIPQYGDFNFQISLPFAVDATQTVANYQDGILNVTLPRHQATMPIKITVGSVNSETIVTTAGEANSQIETKRRKNAE